VKPISNRCSALDRAAPGPDFTLLIEARDFIRTYVPQLNTKQRRTVLAWAGGMTVREIAADAGVTERAAHYWLSSGLVRLRELAGAGKN
jgi:DNA-directed RNA polymerase specialized sigma24 family protein